MPVRVNFGESRVDVIRVKQCKGKVTVSQMNIAREYEQYKRNSVTEGPGHDAPVKEKMIVTLQSSHQESKTVFMQRKIRRLFANREYFDSA